MHVFFEENTLRLLHLAKFIYYYFNPSSPYLGTCHTPTRYIVLEVVPQNLLTFNLPCVVVRILLARAGSVPGRAWVGPGRARVGLGRARVGAGRARVGHGSGLGRGGSGLGRAGSGQVVVCFLLVLVPDK